MKIETLTAAEVLEMILEYVVNEHEWDSFIVVSNEEFHTPPELPAEVIALATKYGLPLLTIAMDQNDLANEQILRWKFTMTGEQWVSCFSLMKNLLAQLRALS